MMEPFPYIFSIWAMAVAMACFLSLAGAAAGTVPLSFAMWPILLYDLRGPAALPPVSFDNSSISQQVL